jgi:hypothetical protein
MFRRGDRVVLIARKGNKSYRWKPDNPIWGGDDQYISGIIDASGSVDCRIHWENGTQNDSNDRDWETFLVIF